MFLKCEVTMLFSFILTILREKNGGFTAERGGNERANYFLFCLGATFEP
jgi:hypothetical protein